MPGTPSSALLSTNGATTEPGIAASANMTALRLSTTRILRYANAPDMLLMATRVTVVPATISGFLSKKMRSSGAMMNPPPAPTSTPSAPEPMPSRASHSHAHSHI